MSGKYYPPIHHVRPRRVVSPSFRQGSRKRLFGYLAVMTICCILIYRNSPSIGSVVQHENPPVAPLLGEKEDASRLWYPPPRPVGYQGYTPKIAQYNTQLRRPPGHRPPRTPLFIAFTRNNDMLIQSVLSYIAAGWPRTDIIIVDNSGTMDANPRHQLTRANPFFLDYKLLRDNYGVSILQTPTYLSFAQLQNFFLRTAMAHGWPYFLWSHMDVTILSDETAPIYRSFYGGVLDLLSELGYHSADTPTLFMRRDWALKYFTFDWLTLVNVEAWRTIGSWDTFIPFYATDCDAYFRLEMLGFTKDEVRAGNIYDMSTTIENPEEKFFPSAQNETLNSPRYQTLERELSEISANKQLGDRNEWQSQNNGRALSGVKGQPWTYNPLAFDAMWWMTAQNGRDLFEKKWGTALCRPQRLNITLKDEFTELLSDGGARLADFRIPDKSNV